MLKKYVILFIAILYSCKPPAQNIAGIDYYQDSLISDKSGYLIDSTKYFFPATYMQDSTSVYLRGLDTFKLKWYSADLRCFKEPILYNYYLGCEVFRFLWLRSFNRPVLITVKHDKSISVTTKILETIPDFLTRIYLPEHSSIPHHRGIGSFSDNLENLKAEFPNADSIVLPRYNFSTVLDTTYTIQKSQWDILLTLVNDCDFWEMMPCKTELGLDGAHWILEAQTEDKYQFVERWSPRDSFSDCCKYIISLSAAKDEEIY